jgi:hypothetical protein
MASGNVAGAETKGSAAGFATTGAAGALATTGLASALAGVLAVTVFGSLAIQASCHPMLHRNINAVPAGCKLFVAPQHKRHFVLLPSHFHRLAGNSQAVEWCPWCGVSMRLTIVQCTSLAKSRDFC